MFSGFVLLIFVTSTQLETLQLAVKRYLWPIRRNGLYFLSFHKYCLLHTYFGVHKETAIITVFLRRQCFIPKWKGVCTIVSNLEENVEHKA